MKKKTVYRIPALDLCRVHASDPKKCYGEGSARFNKLTTAAIEDNQVILTMRRRQAGEKPFGQSVAPKFHEILIPADIENQRFTQTVRSKQTRTKQLSSVKCYHTSMCRIT